MYNIYYVCIVSMANRENLSKLISEILYANWSAIKILVNNFTTQIQQYRYVLGM